MGRRPLLRVVLRRQDRAPAGSPRQARRPLLSPTCPSCCERSSAASQVPARSATRLHVAATDRCAPPSPSQSGAPTAARLLSTNSSHRSPGPPVPRRSSQPAVRSPCARIASPSVSRHSPRKSATQSRSRSEQRLLLPAVAPDGPDHRSAATCTADHQRQVRQGTAGLHPASGRWRSSDSLTTAKAYERLRRALRQERGESRGPGVPSPVARWPLTVRRGASVILRRSPPGPSRRPVSVLICTDGGSVMMSLPPSTSRSHTRRGHLPGSRSAARSRHLSQHGRLRGCGVRTAGRSAGGLCIAAPVTLVRSSSRSH